MSLTLLKLYSGLFICLIWFVHRAHAQDSLTPVPKPDFSSEGSSPFGYYEYLPPNYQADSTVDFPLIIYLHGLGDKGNGTTELDSVLRSGVAQFLDVGNNLSFLVMSPQSNIGWWDDDGVNAFLDFILDRYRVDRHRVYVTGISAGGIEVFSYAAAYPRRLAAIVPITGKANNIDVCDLREVPTWAFHNEDDPIFNPKFSIESVAELNECQPTPSPLAKVTIYPSGGHDAWTKTYNGTGMGTEDSAYNSFDIDIFDWMLQFAKDTLIVEFDDDQVLFPPEDDIFIENYAASSDGQHSYSWTQLSGPDLNVEVQTEGDLNYQDVQTGNYRFSLTVTDNFGHQVSDTITVNVRPVNAPPLVEAGMNQTLLLPLDSTTFSGTVSDPERDSIVLEWRQVTDTSQAVLQKNDSQLNLRNLSSGSYTFQLSATDQYDSMSQDIVQLTVVDPPKQIINSFPYQDSFEETNEVSWQSYGRNNSWKRGELLGEIINQASEASQAWVTNIRGDYQADESSFILSPVFDFSNLNTDPTIQYDVWSDTSPTDSVYLSVTFDQGLHWKSYNLASANSTDGWVRVSHILEGTAGQGSVRIRIGLEAANSEGYEGIAIDNMVLCRAGTVGTISDTTLIAGKSISIPIEVDNPDIITTSYQVTSSDQEVLSDTDISIVEGALQISAAPDVRGETTVTVSSTDVCVAATSFVLTVDQITALDNLVSVSRLQLYPNPSTGYYQIESEETIREVRIYNPAGQLLEKQVRGTHPARELSFDIYGHPNGIYYLQVETDRNVLTRKMIKY
ncbi:MAG: T9SS type A sorting domain-containing protein [Bacteroidota bacterium]